MPPLVGAAVEELVEAGALLDELAKQESLLAWLHKQVGRDDTAVCFLSLY